LQVLPDVIKYLPPPQSTEESATEIIEGENSRLLVNDEGLILIPAVRHASEILPQSDDSGRHLFPRLSDYYCNISTLNKNGARHLYSYRTVWLKYRQSISGSSGGTQKTTIILNSSHAEGRAKPLGEVENVIRAAKCVVPDHPDALLLLRKQLLRFDEDSWAANSDEIQKLKNPGRQPLENRSGSAPFTQHELNKNKENFTISTDSLEFESDIITDAATLQCSYYWYTVNIVNGEITHSEIRCVEYIIVEDGTGGGGSGGSSPDPGDCDPTLPCMDDGTGGTQPPPPGEVNLPLMIENDLILDDTVPDCDEEQTEPWKIDFCASSEPTGIRLEKTLTAFNKIEQRGAECINIVSKGRELLENGNLRYFPRPNRQNNVSGGWGFEQLDGGLALLMDEWVDNWFENVASVSENNGSTVTVNFEFILIHEIEHVLGRDHIEDSRWLTPNANLCSGLN